MDLKGKPLVVAQSAELKRCQDFMDDRVCLGWEADNETGGYHKLYCSEQG